MKVANVLLLLSLLALILFDVAQSRRSRSKNSIKKRNQRLNEKRNKHTRNKTLKKENSRNAFQNSDIIKALEIIEEEVMQQESRLRNEGLETSGIDDTICCFAEKVETWVDDPNGPRWEYYVKTADHETFDKIA